MRVLLCTTGSHGDINPFIAIGRALIARGHKAALVANPYYQPQIEEAGVEFFSSGETISLQDLKDFPDVMHPRRGSSIVMERLILPYCDNAFKLLPPVLDSFKPDAVIHHHICLSVPWICEKRGIPCANTALAPMMWLSPSDTLSPFSWSPVYPSAFSRWILRQLSVPMLRLTINPPINRLRSDHGLKPMDNCWRDACRRGDITLGLWSPHFRPPLADDPERALICGFPWYDRHGPQEHTPDIIERYLDAGPEPILFSLGTAAVHVAGRFYDIAADACRILGRRGMLLVGSSGLVPRNLPPGVSTFTYVPFSTVMPRVAASVHHAGIGTTAQSLRAGRPTVLVPHAHDQYDNAARAMRLGLSETVNRSKLTPRRLADALAQVLEVRSFQNQAGIIAAHLKHEDGAVTAAAAVEKLVGFHPPAPLPSPS